MKKSIMIILCCLLGIGYVSVSFSRNNYIEIKHARDFYRRLDKASLATVLFYADDRESQKQKINFRSMSSRPLYRNGKLRFFGVNIDSRDLHLIERDIEQDYDIMHFPACMLFKYSAPVRDKDKKAVRLEGVFNRDAVQKFINRYVGQNIQYNIERAAEIREEARQANAAYFSYGFGYPYYGGYWGGPYGYGYGYGPGFSIGIGL